MLRSRHISMDHMLPYFLNLIAAGEGSLPDH